MCLSKKISQVITIVITMSCLLLSVLSSAQEQVELKRFNQVAAQVKELMKSDLELSLKQLTLYKDRLNTLTIEQNLLYFKLLTEIQVEQHKYSAAKKTANEGLTLAKRLASPSILISELLYLKGLVFESLGNISQATIEYKKGLEVAESLHHKVQVAVGLINLGAIAYLTDDYKGSLVLLNDAYNIAEQTNDDEIKGVVNTELGIVYSYLLQDKQSMAYYQNSYLHFKKAGMLSAAHNSLNNIATTHIVNEDYQQAIVVLKKIIVESNKDTPSDNLFNAYLGLAWAHLKKTDSASDLAYLYLMMAKQYLPLTEKVDYQLYFYIYEANILYDLKRYDDVLITIAHIEKILINHQQMPLAKKQIYVTIIELKASVFYQQEKFKLAYKTISNVIVLTDKLYKSEDNLSIAKVRLKLEAERADIKSKLLHNQSIRSETSLHQANLENKEQRFYLIISILVSLAFAWVLLKLMKNHQKLKIVSDIDTLTGIDNRGSLMKKAQEAFNLSKKKRLNLSILMVDVDHLKKINDSLGHNIGDKVLAKIASISFNCIRKSDIFGRFGEDEFMVILPKTSLKSAMVIGEYIRLSINEYPWQFSNSENVSVSIGVASLEDDKDLISLVKRAGGQLNQAKLAGRNKVYG